MRSSLEGLGLEAFPLWQEALAFQFHYMPLKQADQVLLQALSVECGGGLKFVGKLRRDVSDIQHFVLGGWHEWR